MNIAIIGAGNVGRALATAAARAGHTVKIADRDPQEAQSFAQSIGIHGAASNIEAVSGSDIVIPTVPFDAIQQIANDVGTQLDGKVLIDVTNRFDPTHLQGKSNAELIQEMVPGARVVKAFNTLLAARQSDPVLNDIQLDGFVAADDADAKQQVLDLVKSMGLRPIDAGPLAMSRALEGMALLNISLNMTNGWSWQTGWKLLGPTN